MQTSMKFWLRFSRRPVSFAMLMLAFAGCGDSGFDVASTSGVVLCNGQPVTGGLVYFEPKQTGESAVVGKVGLGTIDAQGNFTVTTYENGDGAVVGPHVIKVGKGSGPGCDCAMNADRIVMEVDVASGAENVFEVVLPKKTRQDQFAENAEADENEDNDD